MTLETAVEVLVRVEKKVDDLASDVKSLAGSVVRIDRDGTHGMHEALDNLNLRVSGLESTRFTIKGAWATIVIIAGTFAGLAGLGVGIATAIHYYV